MTESYVKLELLVQQIQRQLAPESTVSHNVKLPGFDSETPRQIDVLVEQKVGQYDIKIIIDCKDYKHPVDVKGVEEFYGLFQDVRAHKGVLVSPKGFTETARIKAKKLKIELYSPFDTQPHKWQVNPLIPAMCDFRSAAVSFGLTCSAPAPFKTTMDFYRTHQIYNAVKKPLGTPFEIMVQRWNDGLYPIEEGTHESVKLTDEPITLMDNGFETLIPITLELGLMVKKELFVGQFPITKISGFKDELNGGVITNAFEVGVLDPNTVERTWKKISDISEALISPVIILQGLVCWKVS